MKTFETLEFWRGMSARFPTDHPSIQVVRTDRRPRDSSQHFHDVADEWFFDHFGVKYRSQAVFVTSMKLTAQAYAGSPAHTMRIIPLDEYRYCWSPNVTDLLFTAKEMADAEPGAIRQFLDAAGYVESDLEGAHKAGHELMLRCDKFVAIPEQLVSGASNHVAGGGSGILLPAGY